MLERPPTVLLVEVRAAADAVGEFGKRLVLRPPEITHTIAVLAVPFGPQRREVAHLVAALPHIPQLGDQFESRHDGILLNEIEERRQTIHFVEPAGECRSEIDSETVDMHLGRPYRRLSMMSCRT